MAVTLLGNRDPQTGGFVSEQAAFPLETSQGRTSPDYAFDFGLFDAKYWQTYDYQKTPIAPRESEAAKRAESQMVNEMMSGGQSSGISGLITNITTGAQKLFTVADTLMGKYDVKSQGMDNAKPRAGYPEGKNTENLNYGKVIDEHFSNIKQTAKQGIEQVKGLFNLGLPGPYVDTSPAIPGVSGTIAQQSGAGSILVVLGLLYLIMR